MPLVVVANNPNPKCRHGWGGAGPRNPKIVQTSYVAEFSLAVDGLEEGLVGEAGHVALVEAHLTPCSCRWLRFLNGGCCPLAGSGFPEKGKFYMDVVRVHSG